MINNIGGKFFIRDLNSSYGTKVDGKEVSTSGVEINDGAQVHLGTKTVMEFNILTIGKEFNEDDKTVVYERD